MIQIDFKAAVMLFVTLLLGVALGALGAGALARQRDAEVRQLRQPPGFVAYMTSVIAPHDSQRTQVDAILTDVAARNDSILHGTNAQLRLALDAMRARLAPLLDVDQRARLEHAAQLSRPVGPGGPARGGGPPSGQR